MCVVAPASNYSRGFVDIHTLWTEMNETQPQAKGVATRGGTSHHRRGGEGKEGGREGHHYQFPPPKTMGGV